MNKEKYIEMRNALMSEIEVLLAEGKIEESNAKMEEVKALDNKWEEVKLANANLNALKDNTKVINLENKSMKVEGETVIENTNVINNVLDDKKIYENAWAKHLMGRTLETDEKNIFDKINSGFNNAYTHTTVNTPTLIPETVVKGIWARAEEMYPLLADVRKYNITGTLTINKHASIDAGDAAWQEEGTDTADEQNTFAQISLTGCELAKAITVSWKLKSMAVEEFLPYIQAELGKRIGVVLGTSMYTGTGVAGVQPQGVIVAINAEGGTPQKVTYTADNGVDPLTYEKITTAISKLHSSYLAGAAIYAQNSTIWTTLANLLDGVGRPLFVPDVSAGGVGRMFGMTVKPDAGAGTGNIVIGNASNGYIFNTNEPMSLATEDHVKARETDYAAYTVVDGKVLDTKAFALLDLI
jgi:HK97 family phage major capsid protein